MKHKLQRTKTYYNYYDSKKIYLSNTEPYYCLFEKKASKPHYVCGLLSRNLIIAYSKTGAIIYSNKNR